MYGRTLAPYDLGVSGPLHPVTQYISMRPGDDVFGRFMTDTLHWPEAFFVTPPSELANVTHHVGVLQAQGEWLRQSREATFQAYDSQLRLIDSLRERGELRLRSLPGYVGQFGHQPAHAFRGLVPYLGEGAAGVATVSASAQGTAGHEAAEQEAMEQETGEQETGAQVGRKKLGNKKLAWIPVPFLLSLT